MYRKQSEKLVFSVKALRKIQTKKKKQDKNQIKQEYIITGAPVPTFTFQIKIIICNSI